MLVFLNFSGTFLLDVNWARVRVGWDRREAIYFLISFIEKRYFVHCSSWFCVGVFNSPVSGDERSSFKPFSEECALGVWHGDVHRRALLRVDRHGDYKSAADSTSV